MKIEQSELSPRMPASTQMETVSVEGLKGKTDHDDFLRLMFFWPTDIAATPRKPIPIEHAVGEYHPLPQSKLNPTLGYWVPDLRGGSPVRVDSPAIEVMTDLRRRAPITVHHGVLVDDANRKMIAYSVRTLFVVDDNQRVLGMVTATDILGEKPMQITQQRGVHHDEITVRDIMTPADTLEVIDLSDVLTARVGDVIATLKQAGRQHALVVDRAFDASGHQQLIRGIFSLTQITRQLESKP